MNPLLAQLDRRLARRGEMILLRRTVGSSNQSYVECRIPAIVRALTVEQLIGSITQQNYFLIVSPTHINQQQWPGGKSVASPLPLTSDTLILRGASKSVQRVAPVFDRGECIRIEINVLG